MPELTAREVADRFDVSPTWITVLARRGEFTGRQLADGTWLIDSDSLHDFANSHQRGRGRNWAPLTAWSMLMSLSGEPELAATPQSTIARMRRRIEVSPAEVIARRVSTRVRWRRFTADDPERLLLAVVRTGQTAAARVSANLTAPTSIIQGYAPPGGIAALMEDHLLLEAPRGEVMLAEVQPEVPLSLPFAPAGVIAADLAVSPGARERAAGLRLLDEMRAQWLAGGSR